MKNRAEHLPSQLALRLMDEAYDRRAWHGPNLRSSIRGLTARQAASRPARGRHNIWEVVVHAAYWKYAVCRRLTGGKRGSFSYPGSDWFARPSELTEKAWRADVALLEREHRKLRSVLRALPAAALLKPAAASRQSNWMLITGIACHDVYHAGQIRLLRRLQTRTQRA